MATQYVFHLGNHPELSAAELEAMVGHAVEHSGNVALTRLPEGVTPHALMRELGGCVKISEIVGVGKNPLEIIIETLKTKVPEGKIEFGLNIYPFNKKALAEGIRAIKEELKERGRSVRFLNQEENLPSATIEKSGILKKGTDMNIVTLGNRRFVTRTIEVQPFDTYRSRDYDKPMRLPHDGMLPPKLALMMINLARHERSEVSMGNKRSRSDTLSSPLTLFDPFCGSGTILGEAMLKGMKAIGSDVDANAVKAATKNLSMLSETVSAMLQEPHIFVKDAIALAPLRPPPDLVVSELDLGPPLIRPASITRIEGIQNNLMPLYRKFLNALAPLLKSGTPVVLAFPLHYAASTSPTTAAIPHPLRNLNQLLQETGFKSHRTLTYHRPAQAVGREIRVLERLPSFHP